MNLGIPVKIRLHDWELNRLHDTNALINSTCVVHRLNYFLTLYDGNPKGMSIIYRASSSHRDEIRDTSGSSLNFQFTG